MLTASLFTQDILIVLLQKYSKFLIENV